MQQVSDPVWTSVFWEHGVQRTEEHDSLDDALSYLFYGSDRNELAPDHVLDPSGNIAVVNGSDEWWRHEKMWLNVWLSPEHRFEVS